MDLLLSTFRKCVPCKFTDPNSPQTPPHKAIQNPPARRGTPNREP
jgi:hypothetical protein